MCLNYICKSCNQIILLFIKCLSFFFNIILKPFKLLLIINIIIMDAPIVEKKKRGRKKLSELALINKESNNEY